MSRPRVEFVASTTIAAVAVLWAAADRAIGVGVILGIAAMSVAVAVVLWLVLRFWPDR